MNPVLEITLRTLLVGTAAVLVELPLAVLLARPLARREFPGKSVVQAALLLPMFLPPTAVGLLLLLVFSGSGLLYEPAAAVLASAAISFPILLRHAQEAFAAVPQRLLQVSASLGAGSARTFWRIDLPLARRGLAVGALLAFARGVSEFGATAVLAGIIPGRTETLASGIDRRLNVGDIPGALTLAGVSVVLGFGAVFMSERILRRAGDGGGR